MNLYNIAWMAELRCMSKLIRKNMYEHNSVNNTASR